jgi:uncharacterized membrane protein
MHDWAGVTVFQKIRVHPAARKSAPHYARPSMNPDPPIRIAAIDWMRGLVMILMALDHASLTWNGGRLAADSAYLLNPETGGPLWIPGSPLDTLQFYTRWVTHLCAPTFLFLSGTSLAVSFEKRRGQGMREFDLDKHLLIRAAVLFVCEGLLSKMSGMGAPFLQVLWAIGASMVAMVFLRRLPTALLVAIGLAWLVGSEWVLLEFFPIASITVDGTDAPARSIFELAFFTAGSKDALLVFYPMTHWLAMMLLGWALGRSLLSRPDTNKAREDTEKFLLLSGLSAMLVWAFIRSQNDYGNLGLFRDDKTIVQWLHMSKYPPALVYSLMELGLMALLLVAFMRYERRMTGPLHASNPLLVFGQTALFFYMLHFILLGGAAVAITGGIGQRGISETYLATGAVLVVLYPICIGYRTLKKKYPKSVLQYL